MDTTERLKILSGKIKNFAEDFKEKQSRIHILEKENLNLKADLEKKQALLVEFEEKLKVSNLAEQVKGIGGNDSANKALKNKLNEYIKEIDKCVALLNN